MSLGVLLLAAGQSRRFGPRDKLLALLAGRPVVAHALDALALPEADFRLAVVSADPVAAIARKAGFDALPVAPGLPQADSLKAGLGWLRQRGITRLLVADYQEVRAGDPLMQIDPTEYQAHVDQASAGAAAARAAIHNIESQITLQHRVIEQAEAGLAALEADRERIDSENRRQATLEQGGWATRCAAIAPR